MRFLRDVPIKQKLLVIIVVTTALALMLAGTGIVLVDAVLFRTMMLGDLTAMARIIGDNSTAALAFDDARVASETLAALRARPHMVTACLFRADGQLFARYSRPGPEAGCPPARSAEDARSTREGFTVSHPIVLGDRRLGTLVVLYDRGQAAERMKLYGSIVALILGASGLLAFFFSSRLRAVIATPVSRLARAAASVSESGDYGIRVTRDSADELGVLVDAFNEMLERVQWRDAELQTARTSLETTLTSIGDAVISTDTGGRIVFANPVARSLLRCQGTSLEGRQIEDVFRIVNEFTRAPVESPVRKVLQEGAIAGLANHTVLITGDGTEIPIDDSAAPIRRNGEITGVVLVFRDVTERRRAQQDAAYLAAIVESSDDAIVGKSPDGIIQSWNAGAERLYGYRAEEVIGHPMAELLPAERKHEESNILERLRMGHPMIHFETIRVRNDGSSVEVSLTISPIRNKLGQVVGISHVARDITDQKRAAEKMRQTQKLESLGILAGGIAHDFNNLLTGILGNASLALEQAAPGSHAKTALEEVIKASERAAQLAGQMLAYSGKGRFVLEHIDFSERVCEILPLIKGAIPPAVELRLELDQHLPLVEADAAQIQQLIMNVIINGAEAIAEGTRGALTIGTRAQHVDEAWLRQHARGTADELTAGEYVLFEVTDTGSGMDEATLARIFDPFFTTKFTGRGLGLAAVLGIVRGHHGSVQVMSRPGEGSVFRFLFPAAEKQAAAAPLTSESQPMDMNGAGVVLVVDDEQVIRNLALHTLEWYGYEVLLAEDGAKAVEIFTRERDRITCVVLDLTMPLVDGEEALKRMKEVRGDIPIILSSGFNELQALRRFEGKGLAGFLQKPYRPQALVQKVRSVSAASRSAEARSG